MVIISLGYVMILVRYLRFSLIIIRDLRNFLVWVCGAGKERACDQISNFVGCYRGFEMHSGTTNPS